MTWRFKLLIHHGASAVFYHNDLAVKTLDIGQGLDQDLRLCPESVLHIASLPFSAPFSARLLRLMLKNGNPR